MLEEFGSKLSIFWRKGGEGMKGYYLKIEIEDGAVEKILERLQKAQEEIYKCYNDLQDLEILKIIQEKEGREWTPPN